MSRNTSYFMNAQVADSFGATHPHDEGRHRAESLRVSDPSLVETVFCGFSIPEADIHCLNYIWLHPNLRLMSGGAWAWRGLKRTQLEAELFDMRDFIPDQAITDGGGDLVDVTLPNGYRYQVLKPLEQIRMSYRDPARGNAMDVTATAVMPPAMLPSNRHFDQVMRTSGTLTLRGEEFRVDGYSVRDRSWGEARTEDPAGMSGIHWLIAIFGDDYAVHVTGLEDPETAQWRDRFAEDAALSQTMNRGWVWKDGRLLTVTSAKIQTEWDVVGRRQIAHRVVVVDETGAEHRLHGQIRAAANWHTWSNVHMNVGLARWECGGRVGHGDSQVAMCTDFVRAAFRDSA
jgi:hypothetical protein